MLRRHRRLSIRPRRCSGRSNLGVSCILVLQGHKVTVVILGRPRRLVEADRRHGGAVAAGPEIRDVDLGAGPPHGERGDVRVAPADRRRAERAPRPRRAWWLDQIRRRVLGVLRSVGAGAPSRAARAAHAPDRAATGRGLLGLVAEGRATGRPVSKCVEYTLIGRFKVLVRRSPSARRRPTEPLGRRATTEM